MMRTHHLPKADMLDIVFEHRNKAYGAYVLRRDYRRHLARGLFATLFLAAVCCFLLFAGRDKSADRKSWMGEPSAVELTDILLPPPPSVKPTEPPSPPSRPTVRDLVPVVVPDHVPLEHMVPSMDELSLADPGITSQGGHPDAPHTGSPSSRGSDVSAPAPEQSLSPEPEVFDFRSVEVAAEYPGGQKALQRFLERNLQDPGELMEDGKQVRVLVRFIVGASGLAGSFELLQSGGRAYDQEVLRVLNRMPRWNPARQNGRDVPMYFTIPVVFALPDRE